MVAEVGMFKITARRRLGRQPSGEGMPLQRVNESLCSAMPAGRGSPAQGASLCLPLFPRQNLLGGLC